jgi:hypothetical protein
MNEEFRARLQQYRDERVAEWTDEDLRDIADHDMSDDPRVSDLAYAALVARQQAEAAERERDALRDVYIAARRVAHDCGQPEDSDCHDCEMCRLASALFAYEDVVDPRTLKRLMAISDGTLVEPPTGEV